jgi:hypothetical protein
MFRFAWPGLDGPSTPVRLWLIRWTYKPPLEGFRVDSIMGKAANTG